MGFPGFARLFCLIGLGGWMTVFAVPVAWSQEGPTAEAIVSALSGLEAPADLDVPALRQQAAERIKKKTDNVALKRPPLSRELRKLPHIDIDIQFNPDSPVIRPESYRTVGRLADALSSPALLSSILLIVGRTEANGKRDSNLALSQRRAEAIRDALVTTFRISSKRLVALGLGEEQLIDRDHPKAAVNSQSSIATLGEVVPVAGGASVKPPEAGHAAKSSTSRSKAGK
ncbi:OmpA family protein [Bradyrhizobium sp.]|uniref:OmpA family protein n=1 Tax=Bradyrhizobium sp. TaxID=376 RepID=UPI00260F631A|nr:OmpA family protein [Bradyrhizobium sp.]